MTEKHRAKSIRGVSKKAWIEFEELRKYLNLTQGDTFGKVIEIAQKHVARVKTISEIQYDQVAELEEKFLRLNDMVKNLQAEFLEQRAFAENFANSTEARLVEVGERSNRHSKKLQMLVNEIEEIKQPKSLAKKMGFGS
ncbi:MAG: hypothetical protein ACK4S6_17465 [Roseateles asaccharophilus]|uniref:hypothetical protein n=1 Tax=Roseateles asaccharophilus TaxID=582607 RepID=UPI0039192D87